MKISIQALELILSSEEMKERVPPEKRNEIEGKGILQAYTLAHEGTSQPKVLGEGSKILKWPRAVIRRLAEKIKTGTKFLVGHGEGTNEHDGRESVGEVLSSFVKEIGGKLATIVIGHFPSKEKVDAYDVCSMEADVHTEDDVVGDITDVTGIALGNSDRDNPAFAGAMRLSTVQCFGVEDPKPGEGDNKVEITFENVKQFVKDKKVWPHQLFDEADLRDDRTFGKVFAEHGTMKADNERLLKANTEMEATNKDAIRKTAISDSRGKLDELMAKGYTDKQKSFIKKQFDPDKIDDLSDKGLDKFVEEQKANFAETAKLFGVEETPAKPGSGDDDTSGDMVDQAMEIINPTK